MLSTGYDLKKEMISRNNPNQTITNTIYKIKIKNSVKKEKKSIPLRLDGAPKLQISYHRLKTQFLLWVSKLSE